MAAVLPDGLGVAAATVLVTASFFTSALTAAFGLGGGLAMLALMGLFMPVAALIPVHGAVQLGSNTGRAWHQRANVRWSVLRPFVLGSIAGAVLGLFVIIQLPDTIAKLALGVFIIAITWSRIPGLDKLRNTSLAIGACLLAVLTMLFGATGPLLSALFAQIFANERKVLVATSAAAMTVQHFLKVVVFAIASFAFASWLPLIAVMIASGFLGTIFGTRLLDKIPEASFRRWFRIGVTLLALDMLRQGVVGLLA